MTRHRMKKYAPTLALALLLGGCAALQPPKDTGISTEARPTASRRYVDTIALSGRLSVRYQRDGKEEALHGSFLWAQDTARTNLTLLSPLGQTMAVIGVSPDGATLTQSGQPVRKAADVDALIAETLGWPLPVSGLRDWLQGFAIDSAGNRFIASAQAPEVSTRDGWRIHYASWQDDAQLGPQTRPRRIDLERRTTQAGDVSIRIVIDNWQAHQP
jgi:outer membrane lipoprotein LolB